MDGLLRCPASGEATHAVMKNNSDKLPATAAANGPVTMSKTSHTAPLVVRANARSPAFAARLAWVTIHGRWPRRNRTRWNATGATVRPVEITDPARTAR